MKHVQKWCAVAAATALVVFGLAAHALDAKIGDLTISGGWARESIGPARTAAAYLELHNHGSDPISITGAASPTARSVALHQTIKDGDVMRMRPVTALELAPGERIALEPGGRHLMFMGLKEPFREGMSIDVTLFLSDGRAVQVAMPVRPIGGHDHQGSGHTEHRHEEGHHDHEDDAHDGDDKHHHE